jgi:hypothetical protein
MDGRNNTQWMPWVVGAKISMETGSIGVVHGIR